MNKKMNDIFWRIMYWLDETIEMVKWSIHTDRCENWNKGCEKCKKNF